MKTYQQALETAIEIVREVLREEDSTLTYEAASEIQSRLRELLTTYNHMNIDRHGDLL